MDNKNIESLIKSVMYFILAVNSSEEYTLSVVKKMVNYEREYLDRVHIDLLPDGHIAKMYYQDVNTLGETEYAYIQKMTVEKLEKCIMDEVFEDEFKSGFDSEKDVDAYVDTILNHE